MVNETAEFEAMVGRRAQQESRVGEDDESARIAREKEGLRKLVFEPPSRNAPSRARPRAPQGDPEIRRHHGGKASGADKGPPREHGRAVASARARVASDAKRSRIEGDSADLRRAPDAGNPSLAGRADRVVRSPAASYVVTAAAAVTVAASLGAGFLFGSEGVDPLSKQSEAKIARPKIEPDRSSAEPHATPGESVADTDKGVPPSQRPEPAIGFEEGQSRFPSAAGATSAALPKSVDAPQRAVPADPATQQRSTISFGGAWSFDDRAPPFVGSIDRAPPPSKSSVGRAEAKRAPEPASARGGKGSPAAPQPEKGAPPRSPAAGHASSANSAMKKPAEPPVVVGQDRPSENRDDNRAEQAAEPPPPPVADEYRRASLQEALEFVVEMLEKQRRPEEERR